MSTDSSSIVVASAHELELRLEGAGGEIVHCIGKLTAANCATLKNYAKPMLASRKSLTLDLSRLTYMDSAGLGVIVGLYVSAKTHRSDLHFRNLNPRIKQLLGLTNLLSAFECCAQHNIRF